MSTLSEILRNLDENSPMTNKEIAIEQMNTFKGTDKYKWMLEGQAYYRNQTKILDHKRMVIGEGGALQEATNLANNKLVHGFIRKLVDQKTGYLLSKPFSIQTDGPDAYKDYLHDIFGKQFQRQLKNLGKESINKGIGWLQVYYDENGELSFKIIPSEEIVPLWKDNAHTELDAIVRFYKQERYEAKKKVTVTIIEFWDTNGVLRFTQDGVTTSERVADGEPGYHFFVVKPGLDETGAETLIEGGMNWEKVPFIPFKYNDEEMPLVEMLKSLVDDYDSRMSDNSNNLQDLPNSMYIVKDYDGVDLGELRQNMTQFRTIKVSGTGGVETISLEINTEAFTTHMDRLRKAIYEFGRGVDTQADKFGNSPSGIALRFLYSDLDMDANIIETEFQASLEQLLWFVDQHLYNTTNADYSDIDVTFLFNRDIVINETEAINNVKNSIGILSDETNIANHPWTGDVQEEKERKEKEQKTAMEQFASGQYTFGQEQANPGGGEDE
ncbi:phage portal protein [Paenibacillus sp. ACRRY]|uniref:phage portal protein n=1 Tax=Paenibacillus sp. ACRRY TaxID=2918208 RepID=UPI001EF41FBE|nr:phage portal protein [Paenibacillus sp. ACRRY]MCG7385093.1 phage portal protein [Paenibacillus sp. ACRRY]